MSGEATGQRVIADVRSIMKWMRRETQLHSCFCIFAVAFWAFKAFLFVFYRLLKSNKTNNSIISKDNAKRKIRNNWKKPDSNKSNKSSIQDGQHDLQQ